MFTFFIVHEKSTGAIRTSGSVAVGSENTIPSLVPDLVNELGDNLGMVTMPAADGVKLGSLAGKRVVDGVVMDAPPDVTAERAKSFASIDRRTDQLIAAGFPHRGLRFSTSMEAQTRAAMLDQQRTELAYPVLWNSLDDNGVLTLMNADELHAFVLAGVEYVRRCIDTGTALKSRVRGAKTAAQVKSIRDAR